MGELYLVCGLLELPARWRYTTCKLFTAGRLSSGYAASLLGITRRAFLDLLQQHHLPVIQYTEDDLAQDLQTLRTLAASRQDTPGPDAHAG